VIGVNPLLLRPEGAKVMVMETVMGVVALERLSGGLIRRTIRMERAIRTRKRKRLQTKIKTRVCHILDALYVESLTDQ
jgi:hypothetical protein